MNPTVGANREGGWQTLVHAPNEGGALPWCGFRRTKRSVSVVRYVHADSHTRY